MKIGMETLQWSADIAMPTETNKPKNKLADFFSSLFAIALAISLFMVAPMWFTTYLLEFFLLLSNSRNSSFFERARSLLLID